MFLLEREKHYFYNKIIDDRLNNLLVHIVNYVGVTDFKRKLDAHWGVKQEFLDQPCCVLHLLFIFYLYIVTRCIQIHR